MSSLATSSSPEPKFQSAQPRPEPSDEDDLVSSESASPPNVTSGPRSAPNSSDWIAANRSKRTSSGADFSGEDHDQAPSPGEPTPTTPLAQDELGVPSSTYLKHIAAEHDIATSLDALTAQNLSTHSFNTFALKRRASPELQASKPGPGSDSPRSSGGRHAEGHKVSADDEGEASDAGITYEQVGDPDWRPPDAWTAWPMQPEEVPRELRKWEEDDTFAALRDHDQYRSSAILSDLLVGITLKIAKERLWARGLVDVEQPPSVNPRQPPTRSSPNPSDPVFEDGIDAEGGEPDMKPISMADDEHALSILQPSVSQILRNLDHLLTSLNHARGSYATTKRGKFPHDIGGARSDLGTSNAEAPAASSSRKHRRPKNAKSIPSQDLTDQETNDSSSSPEEPLRSSRSRKRQRTASPARSESRAKSSSRSQHQSRATSRKSSRSARPPRRPKLGLLDWSTILGTAPLSNFPPKAVLRAGERCADLFREGMSFRILHEDVKGNKDADIDVLPDVCHDKAVLATDQHDSSDEDDLTNRNSTSRSSSRTTSNVDQRNAMHGGVHLDNFLQLIQGKSWWGKPNSKRKPKTRPSSSQPSESDRADLQQPLKEYGVQRQRTTSVEKKSLREEGEVGRSCSVRALRNRLRRSRRSSATGEDASASGLETESGPAEDGGDEGEAGIEDEDEEAGRGEREGKERGMSMEL